MDEWTTLLDSGAQVDVIYTDFAKAFWDEFTLEVPIGITV